jgi:signal transduction histidine kinase/CheY-like chemotaxis protein
VLQEIVNIANVGFVVVDAQLRILLWNKWMREATGQTSETVYGQRADRTFPHIFTPQLVEKIENALEKGVATTIPCSLGEFGRFSGDVDISVHPLSKKHVVHSVMPMSEAIVGDECLVQFRVLQPGAVTAANGEIRDEQAEEGARLDFLAMIGHQIRTPVNGVLNIAELLSGTDLSDEQRRYVKMLVRAGQSLNSFVSELTDLAYLEAGRATLETERTDLPYLVQEVLDLFSASETERKIRAQLELAPDLPSHIMTDHQKLRQILVNLISNAFKFTAEGTVSVKLSAEAAGEAPAVMFEIADTGVGIPENRLATLFDRGRTDPARTGGYYNRTGLGLLLTRELVDLFGGDIEVESAVGKGTTVRVRIPAEAAAGAARKSEAVKITPGKRAYGTWRILLAEDNPVNQRLFSEVLGQRGHDVTVVGNGQEAVRTVQVSGPFDVVLMDISMPLMDGMEATSLIRSLPGTAGQTPILALTAHALEGDRETFLDAGMDGYQSKPVEPDDLQEAIARAIASRKSKKHWLGVKAQGQSAPPANGPMSWLRFPKLGQRRGNDRADR